MQSKPVDVKTLLMWCQEAQLAHQGWRMDSWEDAEFKDGKMWTEGAKTKLLKKGITPITINKIFPILNLLVGYFINNQPDVVAKGRTKKDNELGQVMSEALAYVKDQNNGGRRVVGAFTDMATTGFGCLGVGLNGDPREESITIKSYPWYSIWWDPYASPWLEKSECRYAYYAGWKDTEDVKAFMPDKKQDIEDQIAFLESDSLSLYAFDQGAMVENHKRFLSPGHWVSSERKRIRPVEMWYTVICKGWFAVMPNGQVIDLDSLEVHAQFNIIQQAKEVVSANVKKMRVATFLGNLVLRDIPSPYAHDNFPFVPFVGYLDRFNQPYGVPRQIKEQSMEVNKRRSMALALINSRRTIIEKGASENLNKTFDEVNHHNGFIVVKKGMLNAIKIQEMSELAQSQVELMQQSEAEIKEISVANGDLLTANSKVQSGDALERKEQTQATVIASLLENAKYSLKDMGEKICSLVQSDWTDEKVLRIVDRVTGKEKFVAINQSIYDPTGNLIEVKNDITQSRFDLVIGTKPVTDTMREKNMELIFSAINKAPAEAIGPLLNLGLELSDIPNKDMLLKQIRAATGVSPIDDDLSTEEREAKEQEEAAITQQKQDEDRELDVIDRKVDQAERTAKTEKLRAEALAVLKQADAAMMEAKQSGYKLGQDLINELLEPGDGDDTSTGSSV